MSEEDNTKMEKLNKEQVESGRKFAENYLKTNGQNSWEQVRIPNINLLADYINKAKGNSRTMAEFAAACNVSPSTLSRIVNKFNKRPLTDVLLKKIAKNADNESGVTLEMLRLANGMQQKGQPSFTYSYQSNRYRVSEGTIRRTLTEELLLRGAMVSIPLKTNGSEIVTKGMAGYKLIWDFALETDLFEGYDAIYCDVLPLIPEYGSRDSANNNDVRRVAMERIMNRLAKLFVLDQWQPNLFKGKKLMLAVMDSAMFLEIIGRLHSASVNNSITVALFSENGKELQNEYQIRSDVAPNSKRLLDIPKISDDDSAAVREKLSDYNLQDIDD